MSNKGLNSNEALEGSTATNSSVTLSGIRREKETPDGLDIEDYRPDHRKWRRGKISRLRHPPSRSYGGTGGYGEPGMSEMRRSDGQKFVSASSRNQVAAATAPHFSAVTTSWLLMMSLPRCPSYQRSRASRQPIPRGLIN